MTNDGSRAAVFDQGVIVIYDVASGKPVSQQSTSVGYKFMRFSPDGKFLAAWQVPGSRDESTAFI